MQVLLQVGYLGRKGIRNRSASLKPWLIKGIAPAVSVAAGRSTGAAVTRDGAVYTWGSAPLGRTGESFEPGQVQGTEGHHVVAACLGEYHGVAITAAGVPLGWGSTGDGQLQDLNGVPLSETAAPLVGWPEDLRASAIACGFQHTLVIGSRCSSSAEGGSSADVAATSELLLADADVANATQAAWAKASSGFTVPGAQQDQQAAMLRLFSFAPTKEGLISQPAGPLLSDESADSKLDAKWSDGGSSAPTTTLVSSPAQAAFNETEDESQSGAAGAPWAVEQCSNGPRPAWLPDCSAVLPDSKILPLDRAWHGRHKPASPDEVRRSTQLSLCPLVCKGSVGWPAQPTYSSTHHLQCALTCHSALQLRAAAPEVLDEVKQPWLEGVKNPCYKDKGGAVRCLPYLSIVGVSKCGTTDLYKKLMLLKCAADTTRA
jgi:Regulator of chromosome condensation (RCC1) repeat